VIKVITILTGRYRKVLRRGNRDRAKLIFRSLAVFDRRASVVSPSGRPSMKEIVDEQKPDEMLAAEAAANDSQPAVGGFAVDMPANDDEDEDDDDLALAALDSLDAIEVFKQDQIQRIDRKMNHAMVPVNNFKPLLMLLLLFGGIKPQTNLPEYAESLNEKSLKALDDAAEAIIATFEPDLEHKGIRYSNFVKVLSTTMPDMFEPLNALFEHFLFSKNINLSAHKGDTVRSSGSSIPRISMIHDPTESSSPILNDTLISQLSMSIHMGPPNSTPTNIYASNARFDPLFSTATHGTSLSSFARHVTTWTSNTLLLLSGTSSTSPSQPITIGAYLPERWTDSTNKHSNPDLPTSTHLNHAALFLFSPRHAVFPSNPSNHHIPTSYFSAKTGIALGCAIPPQPRSGNPIPPVLGPASILIDTDLCNAVFTHDLSAGQGAFVPDALLAEAQENGNAKRGSLWPKKTSIEIDSLEVWGVSFAKGEEEETEVEKQRKRLDWEEREAERRRGLGFEGDKDGARHLLEMAGIVGGNRSGGSMG
jgi:hypothetical protein